MKKNNVFKSLMKTFAIVASIGGVLYLFRDKIKECSLFAEDGPLHSLKENCPFCKKTDESDLEEEETTEETAENDDFDDVFNVDPATDQEYVSLNITNPAKSETPEDIPAATTTETTSTETEASVEATKTDSAE